MPKHGAQVVFVPSAWPQRRTRHWELFIQARALENQMYVAGVNTTGLTPVESYAGGTMTADPQGTIICRANEAEQLVFTDLDPEMIAIPGSSSRWKKTGGMNSTAPSRVINTDK